MGGRGFRGRGRGFAGGPPPPGVRGRSYRGGFRGARGGGGGGGAASSAYQPYY
jgi:hypothetical protein